MKVFGPGKTEEGMEVTDIPVGDGCARCKELIEDGDPGFFIPHLEASGPGVTLAELPYHRSCFLRGVFGSVAHQKEECTCYGGDLEDDPNLTARENACASERYFLLHPPKELG